MAGRSRIVVAVTKRSTVIAVGLLCSPRVSKVSTVTGIGGVLVVKLRIVLIVSPVVLASQKGSTFFVAIVFAFYLDVFCGCSLKFGL